LDSVFVSRNEGRGSSSGWDAASTASLSTAQVLEFQQIMREECGVTLDDAEAWARARELANLYRILLAPLPEDPSTPVPTDGSNVVALALPATGKVR
jgi:hypothetical protein